MLKLFQWACPRTYILNYEIIFKTVASERKRFNSAFAKELKIV